MSFRLGLIGAGTIGRLHAESATAVGTEVAGVCDVIEQRAEEVAELCPGAKAMTDIDELLELSELDAVVVAVPNHLHAEYAIKALDAGMDVLLEKPMAMDAAECDEILAAKRRNKRIIQLSFVCRCAPTTLIVERFIESGRFGRIYHARASWIRRRGIPGLGGWFTTKASAGGGVLIDLGVHMIDLIMHLTGRKKVLRASGVCTSTFGSPIDQYLYTEMFAGPPEPAGTFDVEDAATGLLRFEDGLTMELATTWAANMIEDILPSGIMLMGEKGGCYYDIWSDRIRIATEQDGHLVDVTPHVRPGDMWAEAWKLQHRRFAECVMKRNEPDARAEHGREVQAVLDALYRSSAEGREVEVG